MFAPHRPLVRVALPLLLGIGGLFASGAAQAAETMTVEIIADEMCCASCAKKVAAQLYTAPGVLNVKATVSTRTVIVTAKPSPKLTLERLWTAVEKGQGKPSRLTASGVVYTLTRPDALPAAEQAPTGAYVLRIADLTARQSAERVHEVLRGVRGIGKVSVDAAQNALVVEPTSGVTLSPWMLMGVVMQAKEQPLAITGPHGRLAVASADAASRLSSRPASQGENR
jgi:copper chaperone CopZ